VEERHETKYYYSDEIDIDGNNSGFLAGIVATQFRISWLFLHTEITAKPILICILNCPVHRHWIRNHIMLMLHQAFSLFLTVYQGSI